METGEKLEERGEAGKKTFNCIKSTTRVSIKIPLKMVNSVPNTPQQTGSEWTAFGRQFKKFEYDIS